MFWYTNADQLPNKRDDLSMSVSGEEPDVIFVTEVLPKVAQSFIFPAMLTLPGYELFTNFNFGDGRSVGLRRVCIYLCDSLKASEVSFPGTRFSEQLGLSLN